MQAFILTASFDFYDIRRQPSRGKPLDGFPLVHASSRAAQTSSNALSSYSIATPLQ